MCNGLSVHSGECGLFSSVAEARVLGAFSTARPPRLVRNLSVLKESEKSGVEGGGTDFLDGAVWRRSLKRFGLTPRDVGEDAVKGSGHGGQKVNKCNNCCLLRAPNPFASGTPASQDDEAVGAAKAELNEEAAWIVVRCHSSR